MANKYAAMIEEAGTADIFFIGFLKKLVQWSVSQKKVTKEYPDITSGHVTSLV